MKFKNYLLTALLIVAGVAVTAATSTEVRSNTFITYGESLWIGQLVGGVLIASGLFYYLRQALKHRLEKVRIPR